MRSRFILQFIIFQIQPVSMENKQVHKKAHFRITISSHHKQLQLRSKSGPQLTSNWHSLLKKKKIALKIPVKNQNRISISNQRQNIQGQYNSKGLRAVSERSRSSLRNRSSRVSELTKKKDSLRDQSQLKQILLGVAEGQRQIIGLLKQSISKQNKENILQKQEQSRKQDQNESIMEYYEKKCSFYENIIKNKKKPGSRRERRSSRLKISRKQLESKGHYSNEEPTKEDFMDFMPKIIQSILKSSSSMYQADYANREKSLINLRELLLNRLAYSRRTYSHFVEEILSLQVEQIKFVTLKQLLLKQPYSLKFPQIEFLMKVILKLTEVTDTVKCEIESLINFFRQFLPSKVKYSKREISELLNSFKQKLNLRSQQIIYKLEQFENDIGTIHLTYLQKTLIEFSSGFFQPTEVNAIKMFACVNSENIEEIEYNRIFSILLENNS